MTHKERFFATINRESVDKSASWLGLPATNALPGLYKYFKVNSLFELKKKLGDDVFAIDVPYESPDGNHIACAFDFRKIHTKGKYDERTLTVPGFFEDISDPSRVEEFNWPNPEKYLLIEKCKALVNQIPDEYAKMGVMWSANFQDTCAAFGMETALMKMLLEPEMFTAVLKKITAFYLQANEIFYEATRNKLDAVLLGNDFGSQTGLMVDPELLRQLVFPSIKTLIQQAKSYNLKVIYHSCGSIFPIIPCLIALGVDVIHPIQALAKDMEPVKLKENFGNEVAFCGGVDAQYLLVNGTPDKVGQKVAELKEIFPTGLIISPSHEAILPDIPPENIGKIFYSI
jgi:uroporphyrinogen decarboxylase